MCILTGLRNNVGLVKTFRAFSVQAVAFERNRFLWVLHNGGWFCVKCGQSGLGFFFSKGTIKTNKQIQKPTGTHLDQNVLVDWQVLVYFPPRAQVWKHTVCVQQEGFHWPWSVGGRREAVAVSCGQMGAASCLLCIADILAQWAVSTPQHSIRMGQQAELQTPLLVIPSLARQTFFVSFYTHFHSVLKYSQFLWPYLVKSQSGNSS